MSDFPINPSDLPWWGWLLSAAGAWIVCTIAYAYIDIKDKDKGGCTTALIILVSGLAACLCTLIGFIRFVKWAWGG